ncbi:MAG: DsbA family protein [Porphyrobacter sp.]|nr:DsbA family protein [Porphyrobacter sp.]
MVIVAGVAGAGFVVSRVLRETTPVGRDVSSNGRARAAIAERTGRSAGNPQGSLTLVAFNDFLCPVCKIMAPDLAAAVRSDGDVRIEYRDLAFFGPVAERAALIGLAVVSQGHYAAYHHRVMAVRQALNETVLRAIVEEIGADWAQVADDLERRRAAFQQRLQRDDELAYALRISGTPAFLMGNLLAHGRLSKDDLLSAFARARKIAG